MTLPQLPRMDDFARILAAIDTVTGWSTLDRYERGVATALSEAVDADPGSDGRAHLHGSPRRMDRASCELLEEITPERVPAKWPATPAALGGRLRRAEPSLSLVGTTVGTTVPAFSSLEEDGNMLSLPSSRDDARAQPENDERVGLNAVLEDLEGSGIRS